jgi:hypothetical protein
MLQNQLAMKIMYQVSSGIFDTIQFEGALQIVI